MPSDDRDPSDEAFHRELLDAQADLRRQLEVLDQPVNYGGRSVDTRDVRQRLAQMLAEIEDALTEFESEGPA